MQIVVFVGPTLPEGCARQELNATYLPPAAQGDVYRVARSSPGVIALVDGYFSQVPAVWHKEILWAMSRGIHVFGSASMGALRAAELAAFGMEGVGAVYEAYARGDIEDDDEVAVLHGPAEVGYACMSEAMVNVRATLAEAEAGNVISSAFRLKVIDAAKQIFYSERTYENILAKTEGVPPNVLEALAKWLQTHRIDQKREDAVMMLREIRRRLSDGLLPKQVNFTMERSFAFEQMVRVSNDDVIGERSRPEESP